MSDLQKLHPSNKVTTQNISILLASQALDDEQKASVLEVRARAEELAHAILARVPDCADRSAALRALRECCMWSNAAIAKEV